MNPKRMLTVLAGAASAICWVVAGWAQATDPAPLIAQDDALKISDHVYVILDDGRRYIPNVGIVIGDRATMIIDPGLGLANGEIVLGEARKLSNNDEF